MLRKPRRPSHPTVVAYLALFVALGGTAYAAATITGDDVVDESLTGADIKGKSSPGFVDGTLGTYDIKNGGLLSSDVATNTLTAGQLAPNSASTSELKDGAVTPAKLAPAEKWNEVGDADGPAFGDFVLTGGGTISCAAPWENYLGGHNTAAFYRDPYGVVHLKGLIKRAGSAGCPEAVFQLPAGYRPAARELHVAISGNSLSRVDIGTYSLGGGDLVEGMVFVLPGLYSSEWLSLDGISFRCAPAGKDGCR